MELWDNPYNKDKGLNINVDNQMSIPFDIKGTKISFMSRTLTSKELDQLAEQRIPSYVMTSPQEWNPSKVKLYVVQFPTPSKLEPVRESKLVRSYEYTEPALDEALLHAIDLSLVDIHGRMISK